MVLARREPERSRRLLYSGGPTDDIERSYQHVSAAACGGAAGKEQCDTRDDELHDRNDGFSTNVAEMQANDVVTRLFPLHDPDTLEHLRLHW